MSATTGTQVEFKDPYFHGSITEQTQGLVVTYPLVGAGEIKQAADLARQQAAAYFAGHSRDEIQDRIDRLDSHFCDTSDPEVSALVDLAQVTSGFSRHDIVNFGFGIFPLLVKTDRRQRGVHIARAIRSGRIIETEHGYLKRFGFPNPLLRWREPSLLSHFISGNVVGYTSVLSRIGFPVRDQGAAQILKLPSSAAFFPMAYLNKLEEIDPDLRRTIACGYWPGGDERIEKVVIAESDAINVLGSDSTIRELSAMIRRYNRNVRLLAHGHKIGIAYVSKEFLADPAKLDQALDGLVQDISSFDGGACYNVKNVFVQGNPADFAEKLFMKLERFSGISPVSAQARPVADDLFNIFVGCKDVLLSKSRSAFIRIKEKATFWVPDSLFRYVQVMGVEDEGEVGEVMKPHSNHLQTAIVAVPDEKITSVLELFGKTGVSNIHYPGTAALFHVYEEPHDGEFDFVKIRYNYTARFASTNFKRNSDWLR